LPVLGKVGDPEDSQFVAVDAQDLAIGRTISSHSISSGPMSSTVALQPVDGLAVDLQVLVHQHGCRGVQSPDDRCRAGRASRAGRSPPGCRRRALDAEQDARAGLLPLDLDAEPVM
jgi:hypothetical protein